MQHLVDVSRDVVNDVDTPTPQLRQQFMLDAATHQHSHAVVLQEPNARLVSDAIQRDSLQLDYATVVETAEHELVGVHEIRGDPATEDGCCHAHARMDCKDGAGLAEPRRACSAR
jgi:hypothetical protein